MLFDFIFACYVLCVCDYTMFPPPHFSNYSEPLFLVLLICSYHFSWFICLFLYNYLPYCILLFISPLLLLLCYAFYCCFLIVQDSNCNCQLKQTQVQKRFQLSAQLSQDSQDCPSGQRPDRRGPEFFLDVLIFLWRCWGPGAVPLDPGRDFARSWPIGSTRGPFRQISMFNFEM